MARKSHHVVPNSNRGGWDIKRNGSERSSGHYQTKKDAIDSGRQISRNQKSELIIHNRNGRISRSDSHGNDPFPPRDHK